MLTASNTSKTNSKNHKRLTLGNALVGIVSPFMIFAVFDVLLAVNMCINYSFFYIYK